MFLKYSAGVSINYSCEYADGLAAGLTPTAHGAVPEMPSLWNA